MASYALVILIVEMFGWKKVRYSGFNLRRSEWPRTCTRRAQVLYSSLDENLGTLVGSSVKIPTDNLFLVRITITILVKMDIWWELAQTCMNLQHWTGNGCQLSYAGSKKLTPQVIAAISIIRDTEWALRRPTGSNAAIIFQVQLWWRLQFCSVYQDVDPDASIPQTQFLV